PGAAARHAPPCGTGSINSQSRPATGAYGPGADAEVASGTQAAKSRKTGGGERAEDDGERRREYAACTDIRTVHAGNSGCRSSHRTPVVGPAGCVRKSAPPPDRLRRTNAHARERIAGRAVRQSGGTG